MRNVGQFLGVLSVVIMVGCAGTQPREALIVPQSDQSTLYARGLSTTLLVEEAADNAAALRARNGLAATIEAHVKSLTKQASEQIGIGKDAELNSAFSEVIKQTVSQSLNFSSPYKKAPTVYDKRLGAYRAEVIYKVDIGPINDQIMENIKARKNLYERFRTTELFEELEAETQ
ncbi:MAG: hypothetical protein IIA60_07035 [Candidatus Marinimicrobia bacterium]|nr:hypothetical protein [Candidatus Neomarinimicrobiota bacterium]